MDIKEFEAHVDVLFLKEMQPGQYGKLLHAIVGIAGEAGELLDAIKKTTVYGKKLDLANIKEELGDALFYVQAAALCIGAPLEVLMEENYQKLKKRYPDGYTDAAALARADKL